MNPFKYLKRNKKWLFGGLGTTIVSVIIGLVFFNHGRNNNSQIQQGSGNRVPGAPQLAVGSTALAPDTPQLCCGFIHLNTFLRAVRNPFLTA
jgi:hypothetical protein